MTKTKNFETLLLYFSGCKDRRMNTWGGFLINKEINCHLNIQVFFVVKNFFIFKIYF